MQIHSAAQREIMVMNMSTPHTARNTLNSMPDTKMSGKAAKKSSGKYEIRAIAAVVGQFQVQVFLQIDGALNALGRG